MTLHTVTNKDPQNLSKAIGVNPYFLKDYTMAANHFPMRRISSVFETLRLMDVKSKGVNANLNPKDLYQELFFRIFDNWISIFHRELLFCEQRSPYNSGIIF